MRVAVVSNRNRPGFTADNLADHLRWARRAAREEARLVLFPELSLSGYSTAPFMKRTALTLRSRPVAALVGAARELDIYVAFGLALRERGRLYISHALAGPAGLVGHYEKVHLAGGKRGEGRIYSPGREFRVFDCDGVGVGVNICFDGRHPASSLSLAHMGAEVILHPHGNLIGGLGVDPVDWTGNKRAYLGPRAVDTCTCTLICNSVGDVTGKDGRRVRFSGGACVLSPGGDFVARSLSRSRRPHMIVADLDIAGLREMRARSSFAARRPEVYVRALSKRRGRGGK